MFKTKVKSSNILLSISLQSNRPGNIAELCNNIANTVFDPTQVEILFGLDNHDKASEEAVIEQQARHDFAIKYLKNKNQGYLNLYKYLNNMHYKICDPNAYFVQHINDEVRYDTNHWDTNLKRYVGFYKDDIFRLRCSKFKFFNYLSLYQALGQCENIPITTKKWIDLTGWCDFHSADLYQQMVSLYLSSENLNYSEEVLCRDIPILDISLSGLEAGVNEEPSQAERRTQNTNLAWSNAMSIENQMSIHYKANLLRAAIRCFNDKELSYKGFQKEGLVILYKDKNEVERFVCSKLEEKILKFESNISSAINPVKVLPSDGCENDTIAKQNKEIPNQTSENIFRKIIRKIINYPVKICRKIMFICHSKACDKNTG